MTLADVLETEPPVPFFLTDNGVAVDVDRCITHDDAFVLYISCERCGLDYQRCTSNSEVRGYDGMIDDLETVVTAEHGAGICVS